MVYDLTAIDNSRSMQAQTIIKCCIDVPSCKPEHRLLPNWTQSVFVTALQGVIVRTDRRRCRPVRHSIENVPLSTDQSGLYEL